MYNFTKEFNTGVTTTPFARMDAKLIVTVDAKFNQVDRYPRLMCYILTIKEYVSVELCDGGTALSIM